MHWFLSRASLPGSHRFCLDTSLLFRCFVSTGSSSGPGSTRLGDENHCWEVFSLRVLQYSLTLGRWGWAGRQISRDSLRSIKQQSVYFCIQFLQRNQWMKERKKFWCSLEDQLLWYAIGKPQHCTSSKIYKMIFPLSPLRLRMAKKPGNWIHSNCSCWRWEYWESWE